RALEEADRRRSEAEKLQQELLTTALAKALEHSLDTHAQRLAAQESQLTKHGGGIIERINAVATTVRDTHNEQQAALARVTEAITSQVRALAELQQSETQLEHLQETRSEEHTSELQSRGHLVCRLLLEKKNSKTP